MDALQVVARNHAEASENRIHSDAAARRYGFAGALVPGVAVYAYLTRPLVARFGEDWLSRSQSEVRLFKPAYDGDTLQITAAPDGDDWLTRCRNAQGDVLAELRSRFVETLPPAAPPDGFDAPPKDDARPEISWDAVRPGQPFRPWHWQITQDANRAWAEQVADDLPVYTHAAHPHWLLGIANRALTREFVMPAWLHVGSEIQFRRLLRLNDTVEVRAIPLEKWERKGHAFLRVYLALYRDDELTTEIRHTAIFRVAS